MPLDSPVNFAISTRGDRPGLDHLGIQVKSGEELQALKPQASEAELALLDEGKTTCCHVRSDKYWVTDPQGLAWEQLHTLDNTPPSSASRRPSQPRPAARLRLQRSARPAAARLPGEPPPAP